MSLSMARYVSRYVLLKLFICLILAWHVHHSSFPLVSRLSIWYFIVNGLLCFNRFGRSIPWVYDFPFRYIRDPQYVYIAGWYYHYICSSFSVTFKVAAISSTMMMWWFHWLCVNRFGRSIPWVYDFPFGYVRDPQYVGSILSLLGALCWTPHYYVFLWIAGYVYSTRVYSTCIQWHYAVMSGC